VGLRDIHPLSEILAGMTPRSTANELRPAQESEVDTIGDGDDIELDHIYLR
jgi:hypothetical protein